MIDSLKMRIAAALDIEYDEITDESTMYNTRNWDSLSHIKVIVAVEEEYHFKLDENDMIRMTSIKAIDKVIEDKYKRGGY